MQPSILLGLRRNVRPLEFLVQGVFWCVNPLLLGTVARYRGMAAGDVAAAMLGAARGRRRGVNRYGVSEMRALAVAGFRQSA
jgi:succinylarginine dihydrolase